MIRRSGFLLLASFLPALALAQTVTGVTVEPAQIRAGESVKVTVNFEVESGINCGLRIHFGDGATVDYRINQQRDVPLVVPRAYGKPGDFRIMAEPKTVGTLLKCSGKNQTAMLKVAGAPQATSAAPTKTDGAASRCPAGWKLDGKSMNRKTGAFTCSAAPGTRPVRIECPGDLSYFDNEKKGLLGCRP